MEKIEQMSSMSVKTLKVNELTGFKAVNKVIKQCLQRGDVKFTIDGVTSYIRGGEDNEYGNFPTVFIVNVENIDAIYVDEEWSTKGMNVDKWGSAYVTLYTYDMLGKRRNSKIKYSDITILKY
tara:strand:- start:176 stop:544 length:369 start_codon:yes stop_codon:yes gene_type:complete